MLCVKICIIFNSIQNIIYFTQCYIILLFHTTSCSFLFIHVLAWSLLLSVTQLCPTLCDPMECSTPGFPVHQQLLEFTQVHVHWVMPSSHLILCHPLLLLPLIFSSIRVFSNELVLRIRWLKFQNFSFSIIPSSEYSGLDNEGLKVIFVLD